MCCFYDYFSLPYGMKIAIEAIKKEIAALDSTIRYKTN